MIHLPLSLEKLEAERARRYYQRPNLRIHSEHEVLTFLDSVGISLLFSSKSLELPSLWGALCGEDRPVPSHHNDPQVGLAWRWKDSLPVAAKVLYGKFLRKQPMFIPLEMAPYFYALSPNYGDPTEDVMLDYQDGRLSVEAKQVYETLLAFGALPTSRLRRDASLGGKENASRFERALAELQGGFRIAKVAISDANRWGYCYVYDLFHRHFPQVVDAARQIASRQARETILLRYLRTVVAAKPSDVRKTLGWMPGDIERVAIRLGAQGLLYDGVTIEGIKGSHLVSVV